MIETLRDFLDRIKVDLQRLFFILFIVAILSSIDKIFTFSENFAFLTAVLTSTSIVLTVSGISHVVRRILFPNIDLKEFARPALNHPIAASIVFLGVCIVLSVLVVVNVMLLS